MLNSFFNNNFIIFSVVILQKLKLNENYTPVVSGYIYGQVKNVSEDKKNIQVKILCKYHLKSKVWSHRKVITATRNLVQF